MVLKTAYISASSDRLLQNKVIAKLHMLAGCYRLPLRPLQMCAHYRLSAAQQLEMLTLAMVTWYAALSAQGEPSAKPGSLEEIRCLLNSQAAYIMTTTL